MAGWPDATLAPMLFLYQSNRLEQLGQLFASLTQALPLSQALAPEMVLVQSRGMGRWLTLDLARRNGVAANLQFVLPAAFSWRLMQRVLPELPNKSSFAPEVLCWRLMQLLPQLSGSPFEPLQRYLASGETACFELAGKIADIFDQYLVFRPDWIRAWEAGQLLNLGEDEAWQAALWLQLAHSDPSRHRVRMLDEFFAELKPEHLPERITLFGIASLAPMYLALVKRLAQLTDVCLFTLNPCEAYWGDIVDSRHKLKLRQKGDLFATEGHPLLASLGKQGRDFFELMVADTDLDARPLFDTPAGNSLLARLQRDILQLNDPKQQPQPLASDDDSVQIHATHGTMRELEVLKDRLLAMLAADPTLGPADIAVLTPDINSYAPYIDAVFGQRQPGIVHLPYSIADRRVEREEPLLASVVALLELADSRFSAEQVLALLDTPALLRRFGLQDADLPFIQQWVRSAGIHWGRDAAHKASLGLPADPMFSWRWGLDRLLLGSVLPLDMAGEASGLFAELLPYNAAQGQWAELLARFAACYQVLDELAQEWAQATSLAGWGQRLQQASEQLFAADDEDEKALAVLRDVLAELAADAELADFKQPVSLAVVRDWLKNKLTLASPVGFLAGGITFCAMVPMRSIPFRVLCLIGMNDGAYPRDERPVSFDLVAQHPRRGDRSRRFDDRYLFLEAILSARQKLYLSYIGQSARSGESYPPSPLLAELLDSFTAMCGADVSQQLIVRQPLQAFSPAAYAGSDQRCRSFDPTFAKALALPAQAARPLLSTLPPLATPSVLNLQDFIRFWENPVRSWLASRLAVRLRRRDEELLIREPFALSRDASQSVRRQLVAAQLHRKPGAALQQRLSASGWLPPAALGQACLQQENRASSKLAWRLPDALRQDCLPPQSLHLNLAGITLVGELNGLRPEGYLDYVVGKINAAQRVACWLKHLLLCAAQPVGIACQSSYYDDGGSLVLGDEQEAGALLLPWLHYWQQGQQQPLPWFGRTSWAYAEALAKEADNKEKAMQQAWNKWDPSYVGEGQQAQKEEAVNALVFRQQHPLDDPLFVELAETLLLPLAQRLQSAS
ncbi:exodeoxyribonuclease V subunit gamma [Neisseriaceae bacterium TC5R-5]|nr:exodeoxyribonuclease V subunit gamma [Neisseriaceae bacterium TC5R-5]